MNILFVCLGNICRSPMAEGVLKQLFEEHGISGQVDSCGLVDWNVGNPADQRAIDVARENGIDITDHRARQIHMSDFKNFEAIVIMDSQNETAINKIAPSYARAKIYKITDFDNTLSGVDVEDPYHSDRAAFSKTYQLLDHLCENLISKLIYGKD